MAGRMHRGKSGGAGVGFTGLERLEERKLLSVTASFDQESGLLTVTGDAQDNVISIGRSGVGVIVINGGSVPVSGGAPTVGNTFLIKAFGLEGDDQIAIDETNGAMPAAHLEGGAGNDILTGGSGQDVLIGGDGGDIHFGLGGNDRFVWNPGDDTDVMEGGDGLDIVQVNGGNGAELFTTTANGTRVRFDRLDPAPFSIDIGTSESLVVNMNGGADTFSATGNLAALIQITVDGGDGDDTIRGGNGADLLIGGAGHDFVDGQQGNDVIFLGAGDDVFQWDPGDGSDTVEGQDGVDTLRFNGSNGSEIFDVAANGNRVRFTRNLGNIVMDLDAVERLDLNALGGTDSVVVNDLSGTDLAELDLDLAAAGGVGDAAVDNVIVSATGGDDVIAVSGVATAAFVSGLSAVIVINGIEPANDSLTVNALGGNDAVSAATLPAGIVKLTLDGGAGDDSLIGSAGADVLLGGDGNDLIEGRHGNDLAQMGAHDDTFVWNSGDGNDFVDGQSGLDTLLFNGSESSDDISIFDNFISLRISSNLDGFGVDLMGVESTDVNGRGGDDVIVAGHGLAGWTRLSLNGGEGHDFLLGGDGGDLLRGGAGNDTVRGDAGNDTIVWSAGDGSDQIDGGLGSDRLDFFGSAARDIVLARSIGGRTQIIHHDARLSFLHAGGVESLNFDLKAGDDHIVFFDLSGDSAVQSAFVEGGDGNDVIDAADVRFDFSASGGDGNDSLIGGWGNDDLQGGAGSDIITGGVGDDVLIGGDGNDLLYGGDGDDELRGGDGRDFLLGGAGNDLLDGGPGADLVLDAGVGFDVVPDGGALDQMPTSAGKGPN